MVTQGEEGEVDSSVVTLSSVRIEPKNSYSKTPDEREIIGTSLMFFDVTNSSGNIVFNDDLIGDKIVFNGITYRVIKWDALYTTKLHHHELILR